MTNIKIKDKKISPIILALDIDNINRAEEIIDRVKKYIDIFKVGPLLYTSCGNEIFELINLKGKNIFLDLKFNDIPSVVSGAIKNLLKYNIHMLTLHCSGGREMLLSAVNTVKSVEIENLKKPRLLGVTVLTSLNDEDLNQLGFKFNVRKQVLKLASLAHDCGLDGVICSYNEFSEIKDKFGEKFLVVCPGFSEEIEQKRKFKKVTKPTNMPDYIVVGRRILKSKNPITEIKKILSLF